MNTNMTSKRHSMSELSKSRDTIRGYLAIASATAGWPEGLATVVARLAEPVVSARLVEGLEVEAAINLTLAEMDALMAVEVFSAAMQSGVTAFEAFDRVAELKAAGMGDMPGSDAAQETARKSFRTAMDMGLTPVAALLAANMLAGAATTMATRQTH